MQRRQRAFGYTEEDLKMLLTPMANTGKEPLGSMGNDNPLPVLSKRSRMLFDYFHQKFAQVTNPPLDWEREEIVTSLESAIGPEPNLLEDSAAARQEGPDPAARCITSDEMAPAQAARSSASRARRLLPVRMSIKGLYQVAGGGKALGERLEEIFAEVDEAIAGGSNFIVLSDRDSNHTWGPIPSLLLTSAVQHHLLRKHTRTQISMAVEAGDVREIHHVALLIAHGACRMRQPVPGI
ncbi:MAG: glutamate synthase central domain-containing protein [Bifidobacterium bifidum]